MKTEVLKNFIVLEGLDGSGTTTQLNNLCKALKNDNCKVKKTFEPTDGPVGRMIRKILQKEFKTEAKTTAMLYATDRYEHLYGDKGIKESLDNGEIVVCDRYLFSSLAYQAPLCSYNFALNLNKDYPLPEHLFFIDAPVKTCQERIDKRGEEKELFEGFSYQEQVYKFYLKSLETFKDSEMNIHIIDGTKSPENITNEILSLIR